MRKNCYRKFVDFFSNSRLEQILFERFVAFFDNIEKTTIQVSTQAFWTKNVLFLIKTIFFLFTDSHWCVFEDPKKTILSVLSIRHSTYPEERLDEISFLQWIRIILQFRTLREKPLEFLPETSSQLSKLYLRVQATFTGKLFYWKCAKFFVLFVNCLSELRFCLYFFRQGFWSCTLGCQKIFSRKNFWCENFSSILQPFSSLSEKISVWWRQLCCSNVKSALFPTAKQNEGKIILKKRIKP